MIFGINFQPIIDFFVGLFQFVASFGQIPQTIGDAAQTVGKLLVSTPDQYTFGLQAVQNLWGVDRLIANALLVLVLAFGGLQIMIGDLTDTVYVPPQTLIAKVLVGAIGINASMFFCQTVVGLENALSGVMASQIGAAGGVSTAAAGNVFGTFLATLFGVSLFTGVGVVILFLMLFALAIILWVLIQSVERIAMLNLLIVLAPLAMLLSILPQTQRYSEYWFNLFMNTVMSQFLQVVIFALGTQILAASGKNNNSIVTFILGIGILVLAASAPGLLSRANGASSGGGGLGKLALMAGGVAGTATRMAAKGKGGKGGGSKKESSESSGSSSGRSGRTPRGGKKK